jgi:hypothetical protein
MRIAINGWFHDQLATGSGQYLEALAEWLPRAGETHEFVLVKPGGDAADVEKGIRDGGTTRKTQSQRDGIRITHHASRATI